MAWSALETLAVIGHFHPVFSPDQLFRANEGPSCFPITSNLEVDWHFHRQGPSFEYKGPREQSVARGCSQSLFPCLRDGTEPWTGQQLTQGHRCCWGFPELSTLTYEVPTKPRIYQWMTLNKTFCILGLKLTFVSKSDLIPLPGSQS